jgi:hypothetical protein
MYAAGYPEQQLPGTPVEVVRGVNHYTIVLGGVGAQAVAEQVRSAG